jgi:V8-like Glu-specific endopeptidase
MSETKDPIPFTVFEQHFEPHEPDEEALEQEHDVSFLLGSGGTGQETCTIEPFEEDTAISGADVLSGLSITKRAGALGKHAFPPTMELEEVSLDPGRARSETQSAQENEIAGEPTIPAHLAYRAFPDDPMPELTGTPSRENRFRLRLFRYRPTLIFGDDDRRVFNDTSYPFSTLGYVQTSKTTGSGVMVGPRHMLTASHLIDWANGGGWLTFSPMQFDTSEPFGEVAGTRVYYRDKVRGTIGPHEGRRDYACVVLSERIGELTGWMGTRIYRRRWDDDDLWGHMGYPADIGLIRPTWEGPVSLDRLGPRIRAARMRHSADVTGGQSGGPFYGIWDDGPYSSPSSPTTSTRCSGVGTSPAAAGYWSM